MPPLSAWLSDAYPEASVTGAVYLTTYTTKTAVFVLALLFAGAGLCAILLDRICWEWSGNFARQLAILLAVSLWTMPKTRPAKADTYGHVAFSLWKFYVKVLKKVF